jgi:hypothetical protein
MTVIELGEFTPSSIPPREFPWRIVRRAVVVGLTVLTLLAATGSARPRPRLIQLLWSMPFALEDRFAASADAVYVVPRESGTIIAYDVLTGARRWSVPMPDASGWPNLVESAGVVLLQAEAAGGQGPPTTIAIDARTGADLWQRRGEVYTTTADLALLVDWAPDLAAVHGFRVVRLADGGPVWERTGLTVQGFATGGADPLQPKTLITVRPDGSAEVLRLTDGGTVTAARLAWSAARPAGESVDLFADGEHVYVREAGARGSSLTAYAIGSLRQSWRVDDAAKVSAYSCGAVVCTIEGGGYAAYDPASGLALWRAPSVKRVWSVGPGRLLADAGTDDVFELLDDSTGRRIADLGIGEPVANYRADSGYLLRDTRSPANRTAVSTVDLRDGTVVLRGLIDRVADRGCADTGPRLICPMADGRLAVMAFRDS